MIEGVLILNKLGLLRFVKLYSQDEPDLDKLVKEIANSITKTDKTQIIYDFDYNGSKRKLIFRLFSSIYIVLITDDLENELATLDFINVLMTVLDEVFKGVSEHHLIMHPDRLYLLMDEIISGGMVIETSKKEIISNYFDKLKDDENYKFFQNS